MRGRNKGQEMLSNPRLELANRTKKECGGGPAAKVLVLHKHEDMGLIPKACLKEDACWLVFCQLNTS